MPLHDHVISPDLLMGFMISDHIDWCAGTLQVVLPHLESIKNSK